MRCGEKARASRGQARSEQRAISQRAGPQRAGALRAQAIRRAAVMRRCEICAHLQRDPAPTARCARRCGNAACKCDEGACENSSFRGYSVRRAQHAGGAQLSGSTASRWLRRQRVCAPRVGRALLAEHREQSSHCDHTSCRHLRQYHEQGSSLNARRELIARSPAAAGSSFAVCCVGLLTCCCSLALQPRCGITCAEVLLLMLCQPLSCPATPRLPPLSHLFSHHRAPSSPTLHSSATTTTLARGARP